MTLQLTRLADIETQPWRNGGGQTREIFRWPDGNDWLVRVSVANIMFNGPFSVFTGIERWLALIEGDGVTLEFDPWPTTLQPGDEPLRFDGASAPDCRLLGGSSFDLNLMVRTELDADGACHRGAMQSVEVGVGWSASFAMRGLFTSVPGRWIGDGQEVAMPAQSLLWVDQEGEVPWVFESDAEPARAWWLGFSPKGSE